MASFELTDTAESWPVTSTEDLHRDHWVVALRADIVTARTAAAHAAWEGRDEVTRADIRRAALLALPHRRRRNPFDAPGLDEDLLDQVLHPRAVAHVARAHLDRGVRPQRHQLLPRRHQVGRGPGADDHPVAPIEQLAGDEQPQPAGGAHDQGDGPGGGQDPVPGRGAGGLRWGTGGGVGGGRQVGGGRHTATV